MTLLFQLLNAMNEITAKLEEAYNEGDAEKVMVCKRQLAELQGRVQRIL